MIFHSHSPGKSVRFQVFLDGFDITSPISVLLVVTKQTATNRRRLPLKTTEDGEEEEEEEDSTASVAPANEVSADAAVTTVLSELRGIFTEKIRTALTASLCGKKILSHFAKS